MAQPYTLHRAGPDAPHFGRLLHDLSEDFQQRALAKCHARGHHKIRGAHRAVIENLDTHAINLGELAERIGITQQATGKLVRDLERAGYIESGIDSHDKRARLIRLSSAGCTLQRDLVDILQEVRDEYASVLGNGGLQSLEQQLLHAARELTHS